MEYIVFEDLDGTWGVALVSGVDAREVAANMTREQAELHRDELEAN